MFQGVHYISASLGAGYKTVPDWRWNRIFINTLEYPTNHMDYIKL